MGQGVRGSAKATETGVTREPGRPMGGGEGGPSSRRQRGGQVAKQSANGQRDGAGEGKSRTVKQWPPRAGR